MITNAQVSDAGPYVCAAFNAVGRDERRVDVDVWGKEDSSTSMIFF